MKNKILLIISVAVSSISFAQITPTFGVKAGVTSSGIRGESMENLNKLLDFSNGMVIRTNNTGFFVGVNSSIPLGEIFLWSLEFIFHKKVHRLMGN